MTPHLWFLKINGLAECWCQRQSGALAKTKQRSVIFVVLYLWQGVLGKPHLDELVAPIGHIVLGAIPCGDLRKTNKQNKPQSLNM